MPRVYAVPYYPYPWFGIIPPTHGYTPNSTLFGSESTTAAPSTMDMKGESQQQGEDVGLTSGDAGASVQDSPVGADLKAVDEFERQMRRPLTRHQLRMADFYKKDVGK